MDDGDFPSTLACAKAYHSRGTNPDVPLQARVMAYPCQGSQSDGLSVGKDCLMHHSVSYQLYLGVNMILNPDVT